jgi:trehalose 6-phosphate synthase
LARLVIVSNRVALPSERASKAGGLAVALRDALRRQGGIWFGWSGRVVDETPAEPAVHTEGRVTYATLDLGRDDYESFYQDYANSTLWPLYHYRPGLTSFSRQAYAGYMRVNAAFARALQPLLQPEDLVWVHDYHLIPLGAELRERGVANRIGFFLHVPFPTTEILTIMPSHQAMVSALARYDLVGFQTESDVRALHDYVLHEAHGRVDADGAVTVFGQRARVGAFPISIDTEGFASLARQAAATTETQRLRDSLVGRDLIIGVDRLDYSKGIAPRMEAFRELLTQYPEHRERVTFLQIAPISRADVTQYRTLRRDLERLAGHVNGRFASVDWTPIRYLNKSFPRQALAGFFRASRVGFVTPLRDGMNLVAKEYVAAQDPDDPGVLVLSRFAGAARELRDALIVNPYDADRTAEALHRALSMPLDERRERWSAMMAVLRRNTLTAWRDSFLSALQQAPAATAIAAS